MLGITHRLIIITGHYGAGKTNIAVNLALSLANAGKKLTLVDLDIVNPYFRAADNAGILTSAGVSLILPDYANSNLDIPSLPALNSAFDTDGIFVFDVGGDRDGATALGVYREGFTACGYDMLYVANMYRPVTADADGALGVLREIESASSLKVSAIINNSNLGTLTDRSVIAASEGFANELSARAGVPLAATSVMNGIAYSSGGSIFRIDNMTKQLY